MAESAGFNPVAALRNFARNSPWIFMAVALHLIIIAGAAVFYTASHEQKREEEPTTVAVTRKAETAEELPIPPEQIDRKAIPKNEEREIVSFEEDVYIPTNESVPEDLSQDRGDPDSVDNLAGGSTGGTAIGVGTVGHAGLRPSAFGGRRLGPGAKKGRPGGPTEGTEKAVLDGLRWLCRHQAEDGSWSYGRLKTICTSDKPCYDPKAQITDNYNDGLTALSLLAFLGAGYGHDAKQTIVDTTRAKRHVVGDVVKKGLAYLLKKQNPDGSFSSGDRPFMYNESLAAMALTEAYGLSQNRYYKEPAQKAINFMIASQRPNPSGQGKWGWRYDGLKYVEREVGIGTGAAENKAILFDSDISATGWCVMALKSAKLSGLNVPEEAMQGGMAFAKYVTADNGMVGYVDPKQAGQAVSGGGDHYTYHPAVMSALGMCIRIFVEHDPNDTFLPLAAAQVVKDLPDAGKADAKTGERLSVDYYYWYYASIALNQFDGPDAPKKTGKYWGPWNKKMVDAIMVLQDQTDDRKTEADPTRRACQNGGWIVPDRWGSHYGGPVYQTAINVLTLEVYYRFENAFGGAKRN